MKKTLMALSLIAGLGAASADTYAGAYAGSGIGAQYQADTSATTAYRVGIGFEGGSLGGGVDFLNRLPNAGVAGSGLSPYWGAGVGANFGDGVNLAPRLFVGTDLALTGGTRVYGEIGGKYVLNTDDGKGGAGLHGRVGVNFRLN